MGLAYVLTLARARAVMADDEAARSAARLDPQCQLAAEIVVDEVRQRALKDSTSFQFYLALLAERVGPLPGVAA